MCDQMQLLNIPCLNLHNGYKIMTLSPLTEQHTFTPIRITTGRHYFEAVYTIPNETLKTISGREMNGGKWIVLKPTKPYKIFEFEYLFGFKSKCEDYDENRMISVDVGEEIYRFNHENTE